MNNYRFAGEPIPGPGAALRRWADEGGSRGWALVFSDPWTRHPLLVEGVAEVRAFLDAPGTPAILPLEAFENGVLRYRGEGVLLAELLGKARGAKAALEFLAAGCTAVADALEKADPAGLPSHGALGPWRIALQPDGTARLLGFGVPAVEALAWLDEETETVDPISLRFFPPERLEDRGEDGRSDLFALGLCTAELIAGAPILAGTLNAVLDTIYDGKVADRVEDALEACSDEVVELLCSCVEHRIGDRPKDLRGLAGEARQLAAAADGPSLVSLIAAARPAAEEEDATLVAAPLTEMVDFDVRELAEDPPTQLPGQLVASRAEIQGAHPDAPEAQATEVVDLAELANLSAERPSDTLLAAQGIVPADLDVDPETTELTPMSTDEAALPPEVPPLPDGADLSDVRSHATSCVTRAELLAAIARRSTDAVRSAKGVTEADRVAADAEADRARKAASTARSSAGLLELDDDVAGARITLDLVIRAEQQAEAATLRVQQMAADVVRRGRAARAAQEARSRAESEAERHVEAASTHAEAADTATRALEADREAGRLADPQALGALARAWEACERADEAAGEAEAALSAIRAGESHSTNLERARKAQQTADDAHKEALAAIEQARKLERAGAETVSDDARAEGDRAEDAATSAEAAATRARDAAALVPSDGEAGAAATLASTKATEARSAATRAAAAVATAENATDSGTGRKALSEARTAADAAAAAAVAAREAAEQVARRAGAAAEKAARVAELREQATAFVGKLQRLHERSRADVDEARTELEPVSSPAAHRAVERAGRDLEDLEEAVKRLTAKAAKVDSDASLGELQAAVGEARNEVRIEDLLSAARKAAADELAAIEAEKHRASALADARDAAAAQARTCTELADAASKRLKPRIATLRAHGLPDIDERCTRAMEIVDIALFQAGEARQSADWAKEETDPEEAQAYADTAASFAERITLDLPEADALVEEAEALAAEVRAALEGAKAAARSLGAEADGAPARLDERVAPVLEAAKELEGQQVDRARELLIEARDDVDEARATAITACDKVLEAKDPEAAEAQLDVAREAVARLAGLEANVRDRADALDRITATAREEMDAVRKDRERAKGWAEQAGTCRAEATKADQSAREAVTQHRAVGDAVREALSELDAATASAASASAAALTAARAAASTTTAEEAANAAQEAREALTRAEQARDKAQEAGRRAEEAAAAEAREREATRLRKVTAAREVAGTQASRAKELADRMQATQAEVAEELGRVRSPVAQAEADLAGKAVALLTQAVAEAEAARVEAEGAEDEATAEAAARRAAEAATRAGQIATKAESGFQRARDKARAAAQEADALSRVAEEARQAVARAESAVNRAKEEARRILQLKLSLDAKKELAGGARDEIQGAERALAKVSATAPMAAEATDLGTAQALLATCRATVARAEERADAVAELVAAASRAMAEEAERRAKALADARQAAREPAERAREAAADAKGWLDAARRNADGVPAANKALKTLEARVAALATLSGNGTRAAEDLDELDDTAAIRKATTAVGKAVDGLERLLAEATAARDEVERVVRAESERRNAVRASLAAAQELRAHTQEVATRAGAAVEELETWVGATDDPGPAASEALAQVKQAAGRARAAVEALDQLIDAPPLKPEVIQRTAEAQLEQAIAGLEAVVAGDATCREAVAAHKRERAEAARRAEEAERKAAAEEADRKAQAKLKKADSREAKRKARLEQRRQRFLERRGQSDEPRERPADGASTRPAPSAAPSARPEADRPRRRPRRRASMPPEAAPPPPAAEPPSEPSGEEDRQVRRWQRGKTSATEGSTRPRRRPRPASRPPAADPAPSGASGADALLQRLRERHKRDGED